MADQRVTYPVETIAKLLMLTPRRIQQLVNDGKLPRAERGRYELAPVVQAYITYLRGDGDVEGGDAARTNKSRLIAARAQIAEAEVAQLQGKLVDIDTVAQSIEQDYAEVRTKLLGIPPQQAPRLHRCKTVRELQDMLAEMIADALEALSRGGVKKSRA